jgi:ABC-type transport system involved in multi-copper enzyme maturation permease subunit
MIWEVCRKELLRNFQSFRFFALFAVTVFLFAISPFLLSTEYHEKLQEYNQKQEQFDPRGVFIGAHRRPNPLSFVFEGGDGAATNGFGICLDLGIMPQGGDQYGVNVTFPGFQTIDWIFIIKVLFSLFAIILTFDAISGEKELGTLALMCSNNVSRASILMGKYLGALITVAIPTATGMLVSMIIVGLVGNFSMTIEVIFRLALVMLMSLIYISLFVTMGITVSSIVHRSSLSLLLSLSLWIILVIVIPNLGGIIAESVSDVLPEHEFFRRHRETFGQPFAEWKKISEKKTFETTEEASEELSRILNESADRKMKVLDSYRNTIYINEDLAINISRISPASALESSVAEIVDAGVSSQRRFYRAVRNYYDLIEEYTLKKAGKVRKHISFPPMFPAKVRGETVRIGTPPSIQLPEDVSDFPALPEYRLSVGESVLSCLWNMVLLAIWNVILLMVAHVLFLRYDVR